MRPPRNHLNLNLPAQYRRSHADLYELIKANNFCVNASLFLERAEVEVVEDKVFIPRSMPQTEPDHHWPVTGQSALRRPSSEPISIVNFADSVDHDFEDSNMRQGNLTTEQGLVRHLVENCGQAICGSPLKMNYLANYRPSTEQSPQPSPAISVKSSFDTLSIASTQLDIDYNDDGDDYDDEVFLTTELDSDDELIFQMDQPKGNLENEYRRIFTSLQNIPNLEETTFVDHDLNNNEDEVDSAPGEVILDQQILRGEEPRIEVDPIEEVANRRMRTIREVAAELRQISLDYERRVRLRNIAQRLHFQSMEPPESPFKLFLIRLRHYLLNKFDALKRFVQSILRAAFGPPPTLH